MQHFPLFSLLKEILSQFEHERLVVAPFTFNLIRQLSVLKGDDIKLELSVALLKNGRKTN